MASDVDICNLALAHLGDTAKVVSIDPPNGSPQASHCSRFYPIARDSLLEMHTWGFATRRTTLASVANPSSTWQYAYGAPNNVLNYIAILDPNAADDYSVGVQISGAVTYGPGIYAQPVSGLGVYTPQNFVVETDANGNDIILTNQQNAVLRYTGLVTDTTKFSPLFVSALSHLLASHLAGPLLKGESGAAESKNQLALFERVFAKAQASDSNQRKTRPPQGAPWMTGR